MGERYFLPPNAEEYWKRKGGKKEDLGRVSWFDLNLSLASGSIFRCSAIDVGESEDGRGNLVKYLNANQTFREM